MAYVYYPPRTANFFPGGPPYLAGLGDYAADLATYKEAARKYEIANKVWHNDKKKYEAALAKWISDGEATDAAYGAALVAYVKDKKAWDKEAAAYAVSLNSWGQAYSQAKSANITKSKQVAETFRLSLPQSYFDAGACISAADKAYFTKNCTVVKGLGAVTSYGSACGMMRLPVCNYAKKPTLRKQPSIPPKPIYPAKPTLRAAPVAPIHPGAPPTVVTTTPVTTPTSTPVPVTTPSYPTVPEEETPVAIDEPKQANVLMGGLIVAAVLGGGYLVYRTLKKPKAA